MQNKNIITPEVVSVGVNDRRGERFEGLWPLPDGVSYNSYVVLGERIALVDTVEVCFADRFLANIERATGGRTVDYLVINHMEPDHSSSINAIRARYPEITIVGNARTLDMVAGYYGAAPRSIAVADGDTLSLGRGLSLRFYLTPMVHWPETMMSYCPEQQVLFSGDAFGCFGALNGAICDTDFDTDAYIAEAYRYYSNIVGKYGTQVVKAIDKLTAAGVSPLAICSTHGPVWKQRACEILSLYRQMGNYDAPAGALIVYGTMYGNTEKAAEYLASRLADHGVRRIGIRNACTTDVSYLLADAFRYDTILVGSPTYNAEIFPPVEAFVKGLCSRGVKKRTFGAFGSFTWACASVRKLTELATTAGMQVLDGACELKQGFEHNDLATIDSLADRAAAGILERQK